uniref:Uncharacterized protein n=1 Tax=Tanacetum cinerariifolium TaxID=118510 RepID=A0A6L2KR70_TANCI|nr:hypothetical protein [Tanacetum cinerariifolium]
MIEHVIHTVKTDMVIHTEKTKMMRLVAEIKCVGKIVDAFDKTTGSSNGLQLEKVDLNYVHALNEPHLHEIRVVPKEDKEDPKEDPADYHADRGDNDDDESSNDDDVEKDEEDEEEEEH